MIDSPASFEAEAAWQGRCAVCGRTDGEWHAHHVIAKQTCRREGAPSYDPDNALRLCAEPITGCHWRHEQAQVRVPLRALREENLQFAVEWLGAGAAVEYLTRHYAGTDGRLADIVVMA